jgi:four helix bundle protein
MGESVRSVEDLEVFKMAHRVVLEVYRLTQRFPVEERFGLASQLRRAAASVPANLSEGAARIGSAEFRRFAGIARGSVAEASYHLLLAKDLGYVDSRDYRAIRSDCNKIARMLTRLIRSLSR